MKGERLRKLREERGLTQKALSVILPINRHSISTYELGKSQPSHEDLVTLADYFGVSTDYLLGRCEDYYPTPEGRQYLRLPVGLSDDDLEILTSLADILAKRGKG